MSLLQQRHGFISIPSCGGRHSATWQVPIEHALWHASVPRRTVCLISVGQARAAWGDQGDLVSRLIREITRVTIWVIGLLVYILTTKPSDPPSRT